MSEEEIKALNKEVKKLKRIATECASEVHDLVEDRLLADYSELIGLAQKTVAACEAWASANARLSALDS